MAEGWSPQRSFKDTFGKASGDAEELFCEPCINEENWVAVEGYCQICKEYMCGSCLKFHRKQKLSRSHTILDKKQMPTKPRFEESQSLCTVVCTTHHPEILRYFCQAHKEPGCIDCMTLNHATCKKDRIQDISDGFQATKEFKQIRQKLDTFHEELKLMKKTLDNDFDDIEASYNTIQENITEFRKQINDYLDEMQKQITDEVAKIKKEHEAVMNKIRSENQSMKSELEDRIETLKNDTDMNAIFVHAKQAMQRLVTMEKELHTIKKTEQEQKHYVFSPSPEIQRILSTKEPLGKLSSTQHVHTTTPKTNLEDMASTTPTYATEPNKPKGKLAGTPNVDEQKTPLVDELSYTPNINTTVAYRKTINVKSRNDTSNCWIQGCTLHNPQCMVVIDAFNNMVKIIDLEAKRIIFSYSTSSRPLGITTINAGTVAVTLPQEGKIEQLHVTSNRIQHQKYINCSTTGCRDIAYHDDKFAVTYSNRVEILDIHGKVLHRIQPKQGTEDVLQLACYITFGNEINTVIVSDLRTHKVHLISFKGQILQTYSHNALRNPAGIALTEDGILYVCSCGNGCVHVVSPDFKRSKIILQKDKHVKYPRAITYCDIMQRLYISNDYSAEDLRNSLQVYDLNI